ncbi:unnamed protein product [Didymodactylos carnosus]|uniref:IGFBP-related protein 1 n=1 Tax=Didymodactylos carnosus TaxID=1234261 RepID=A0A813YKD3_9BILA|nr:unnamed protein product [Didymodactylos carnosus]CAF0885659.1 unnamed protein product [Didymodactylos carnosus]CAF3517191.1 unnamed protein product [Didymodactylos carnosus]CAF3670955.1 unnamed protein product [Didymodactylos carnosus]
MKIILNLFLLFIGTNVQTWAVSVVPTKPVVCGQCDPGKCPMTSDKECLAGLSLDACGCCQVCAQRERELCDHPDAPSAKKYGSCGENLQCRIRPEVKTHQEALCECNDQIELCGSDGKTYRNYCHLMESAKLAKAEQQPIIKVYKRKPCDSPPEITVPPVNVVNQTGSNVFLTCEVAGVPLPVVEWIYQPSAGKTIVYPTDDDRISTLVRGGPNAHVLTSWLQIQTLQNTDQGVYTCIATNALGKAEKTAYVQVETRRDL